MITNCLIVDDEPLARDLLEAYVSRLPGLKLVASCENAMQAYEYLGMQQVDLMFLDIEMPLLKGNAFLAGLSKPPAVIVTTAYRDYALEGYELDIVDYLLKPIVFERFFKAVEKYGRQQAAAAVCSDDSSHVDHIYVQSGARHIRVLLAEILYVESEKDYIRIHLERGPDIVVKRHISTFAELLDARFLRVHRSFIINTDKIASFSRFEVRIGELAIPVGESYKEGWRAFSERVVGRDG